MCIILAFTIALAALATAEEHTAAEIAQYEQAVCDCFPAARKTVSDSSYNLIRTCIGDEGVKYFDDVLARCNSGRRKRSPMLRMKREDMEDKEFKDCLKTNGASAQVVQECMKAGKVFHTCVASKFA